MTAIEKLGQMPHLLRVLAQHAGQLVNYAQIGHLTASYGDYAWNMMEDTNWACA